MKNLFFIIGVLLSTVVNAQIFPAIYKGGQSIITGTWESTDNLGNDTLYQTAENAPYEGDMHYRFDYQFTNSFAGVGLNLNNWGTSDFTYNFSPYTHMRIAYKGLSTGQRLAVRYHHINQITNTVVVGGPSSEYQLVEVPLMDVFAGALLSPLAITEVRLVVLTDTAAGSGTVFFDNIELVHNENLLNPSPASAATKARALSMKKGINCANWLEAYWRITSNNYPEVNRFNRANIQELRSAGFDSFRLPVCFEQLAKQEFPFDFSTSDTSDAQQAFVLIDSMIAWAEEMDFKLVIDNHHGYTLNDNNYLGEEVRIKAIWKQLIAKYNYLDPERFVFELYNEPSPGISNNNFRALAQSILDEVRPLETQTHTFIVGPANRHSQKSLLSFTPMVDSNIIYTFHNYEPFEFTYQGFSWTQPPFMAMRGFPEFDDIAKMYNTMEGAQYWADYHKVPVSMGEWGASFHADSTSRCNYVWAMSGHIYNNNMGYFYYDAIRLYDSFGFYNSEVITQDSVWDCFKSALQLYGMVDINDVSQDDLMSLTVAPNPATGVTYLRLKGELNQLHSYTLYDMTGKALQTQPIREDSEEALMTLQLAGYTPGLYRLVIYADNGKTWHRNIVVQ